MILKYYMLTSHQFHMHRTTYSFIFVFSIRCHEFDMNNESGIQFLLSIPTNERCFNIFSLFWQLLLVALITMTVFFRSTMHHDSVDDGIIYLGALYFAIVMILFNGFTEVSMLVTKLPVLYKHRDLHFYPPWAYTLPSWLLSIPTSLYESGMWVLVTYYVVGYDPQFTRQLTLTLSNFFYFCSEHRRCFSFKDLSFFNLQIFGTIFAAFLSASNIFGSFPGHGIFGPQYDSC